MTKKKKPVVAPAIPLPENEQPNEPTETRVKGAPATGTDADVLKEAGFPIIGLGASAGGLAAIEAFFAAMPEDTESGMAFVFVQHLSPDHKSILIDLVKRYTKMQVFKVEDGMEVQPNCAYIIPPNSDMALIDGRLHLMEPNAPHGLRLPIDFFFRSMANDQHERAICIVLSGTGSDGTMGLKVIKDEGGMVMAQEPESAAFDGMPRSASAATPPVRASGTPLNTITASLAEPNAMNNRPKMRTNVTGTTTASRWLAEINCSNVPP